jgi:hypothetical protein
MNLFTGRKSRIAVLFVALVALSFGVSVGLAKSGPSQVKADLHNDQYCPDPTDKLKKVVGWVQITNSKGAWSIVVHLRGVVPGAYHVDLYDDTCSSYKTSFGYFKVGADGSGDNSVPFDGSGIQVVFVRIHNSDASYSAGSELLKIGGG